MSKSVVFLYHQVGQAAEEVPKGEVGIDLPTTVDDLQVVMHSGERSVEAVLGYVRKGMEADARAELQRLCNGGKTGKRRPTDEEIERIMAAWVPGQNWISGQIEKERKAALEARIERQRKRLEELTALVGKGENKTEAERLLGFQRECPNFESVAEASDNPAEAGA